MPGRASLCCADAGAMPTYFVAPFALQMLMTVMVPEYFLVSCWPLNLPMSAQTHPATQHWWTSHVHRERTNGDSSIVRTTGTMGATRDLVDVDTETGCVTHCAIVHFPPSCVFAPSGARREATLPSFTCNFHQSVCHGPQQTCATSRRILIC